VKRAELIMAGFLLVVSLAYGLEAVRYPYTSRTGAGAGFLPVWTSLFGIITALLLIGRAWRMSGLAASTVGPFADRSAWLGVLPVALALVIWVALTYLFGGIVAIALFVFAVTWWLAGREDRLGTQRVILAAVTTVVVTVAIFLIFQAWLDIRLPTGILGGRS
jgi:hypothetical protein